MEPSSSTPLYEKSHSVKKAALIATISSRKGVWWKSANWFPIQEPGNAGRLIAGACILKVTENGYNKGVWQLARRP